MKTNKINKKIVWILGGFLGFYLLIGFVSNIFLHIKTPSHVKNLSKEDFLADYDYFWDVLEENYPMFPVVERVKKVRVEELWETYRRKIEESEQFSMEDFYYLMNDLVGEMGNTAHLRIADADYYEMMVDTMQMEDQMDYLIPHVGFLFDEQTEEVYEWLPSSPQQNKILSFLLNLWKGKNISFQEIGDDTTVIKIDSFDVEYMENDWKEIQAWVREHPDHTNLIIDIRSNWGGNGYYWSDYLVAALSETAYMSESYYFASDGSDFNKIYAEYREKITGEELQAVLELPKLNQEDVKNLNLYKSELEIVPSGELENSYENRYVLVDGGTSSAAGQFAMFCKNSGWAKLVGKRTSEDFNGLTPVWNQLPNSKLIFTYRITYCIHSDGECGQEKGVMPDIYTPDDALEECLEAIKKRR